MARALHELSLAGSRRPGGPVSDAFSPTPDPVFAVTNITAERSRFFRLISE